jgi:hypothetical protein
VGTGVEYVSVLHFLNDSMLLNLSTAPQPTKTIDLDLLDPIDIIELMIDLRIQFGQIEQQLKDLKPVFYAACATLSTAKIERDRAIVTRKLTPAQWTYATEILEQELLLKQLRKQFHQDHEPTGGREITWIVQLLLKQPH